MARILVVDDSITACGILARLIGDRHLLTKVDSGQAALAALEEAEFDLVLLDLLMPDMGGFETLAALKRMRPTLPVLIVSADIQDSTRARVSAAGAAGIVHKPPKPDALLAAIDGALSE